MGLENLKKGISKQRLETYRKRTKTTQWLDAVDVYSWHADVSASLLHPISVFEVTLRNAINDALVSRYAEVRLRHTKPTDKWPAEWFSLHGDWLWLSDAAKKQLSSAIVKVQDQNHKARGFQIKPFHIVPMMKFQFWEDLLLEKYAESLWEHSYSVAFPNAPAGPGVNVRRLLYDLKQTCQLIRETRNRIAHHEPILNFDINQILERMEYMLDLICVESSLVVRAINGNVRQKWGSPPASFI